MHCGESRALMGGSRPQLTVPASGLALPFESLETETVPDDSLG